MGVEQDETDKQDATGKADFCRVVWKGMWEGGGPGLI